ncbi:HPt (histidine-containing phosphotransfer) domain-containing protein [Pseudarthrobacter sp. PvP004]|uniref:hypothetical protein n=1 Tax=Pseudarthrobacter sp. PvP004 TaxID=2817850 RepID=UPI0025736B1C|nr:hypothetical protein [Pseudarthrobacter sp. PvP004]MBP2269272.1 HPt (histidine-containing phosphotransfer) domain-containing protein [Pseudarthrobacter sp. PvP004]
MSNHGADLDSGRLRALAEELGNPEPARQFLTKYLAMLTGRTDRIAHALEDQDTDETATAVLSLKISSAWSAPWK